MRNKFNLNTLSLHNNLQQSIPILTTIFTLPFFLQLKCLLLLPCKVIKTVYWQRAVSAKGNVVFIQVGMKVTKKNFDLSSLLFSYTHFFTASALKIPTHNMLCNLQSRKLFFLAGSSLL